MNALFASALSRRQLLGTGLLVLGAQGWVPSAYGQSLPPELTKRSLRFPADLGSHPDTAIEWWYITGELQGAGRQFGFQLTFFRSRVPATQAMRSAFAAKQLFFAHAAVTDVAGQRLLHDQRIARYAGVASSQNSVDLAFADETDTHISLRDWSLARSQEVYLAHITSSNFGFKLRLQETQALLLQGDEGLSRKGPLATHASYYYSLPQLQVSGDIRVANSEIPVTGRAWLDHEWSQSIMPPDAVGWDWIGMNLLDGSALTAFRLRDRAGDAVWAGGSWRNGTGSAQVQTFAPDQVVFVPTRRWKSPASGASYPVQWSIEIGSRRYTVRAVIDAQELDSSLSTGAIYWEGLSDLLDAQGQMVGRGYLEMTGYAKPLRLS